MKICLTFVFLIIFYSCNKKQEKIKPEIKSITESVYASGIIKSKDQYQVYSSVNGIIEKVFVSEGDIVKKGDSLIAISNELQSIQEENSKLTAKYSSNALNLGKIHDAELQIELSESKMKIDSSLYFRLLRLWNQKIGSKNELDKSELIYKNSKIAYKSALIKLNDLKNQIQYVEMQSNNNVRIANKNKNDFIIRSEVDGVVYGLSKKKGELVGLQNPIAIIGSSNDFILEMQIDEYDILKIKNGLQVLVSLDSYKGAVYEARVTKINPLMNERSKTFMVEAEFVNQPETLYPNITFEANVVLKKKDNALLIPRNYILNDSFVLNTDGNKMPIKIGLKDYLNVEVIQGLNKDVELLMPVK
jgi:multidrug efflux pump subunit AcrA (membrane-fusion protein)